MVYILFVLYFISSPDTIIDTWIYYFYKRLTQIRKEIYADGLSLNPSSIGFDVEFALYRAH